MSLCLRDEEAAGSNPATPTENRQATRHIVACCLNYAFPGVRFWEPVGSGQRTAQGSNGSCYNFPLRLQGRTFGAPGLTAQAVNSEDGREQSRGKERPG